VLEDDVWKHIYAAAAAAVARHGHVLALFLWTHAVEQVMSADATGTEKTIRRWYDDLDRIGSEED
jgi:hypothetical protein